MLVRAAAVPPGFFFDSSTPEVKPCAAGSYREKWVVPYTAAAAASCTLCGEGIQSDTTQYSLRTWADDGTESATPVAGGPNACCELPAVVASAAAVCSKCSTLVV